MYYCVICCGLQNAKCCMSKHQDKSVTLPHGVFTLRHASNTTTPFVVLLCVTPEIRLCV